MSALATRRPDAAAIERVLIQGDLSVLTDEQRIAYYQSVCESVGLNPLTKPFEYLLLGDKGKERLVLYANRSCTDQLRKLHSVSVAITDRKPGHGVYVVTARATLPDGRSDESTGAVPLEREQGEWKTASSGKRYFAGNGKFDPLKGDALANALMKAETKAKRRVTLSICGLGMLDETEVETISGAQAGPSAASTRALPAPAAQPAPVGPFAPPELLHKLHALIGKSRDPRWLPRLQWYQVGVPEGWAEPQTDEEVAALSEWLSLADAQRVEAGLQQGQTNATAQAAKVNAAAAADPSEQRARAMLARCNAVSDLVRQSGVREKDYLAHLKAEYGTTKLTELTEEQAKAVEAWLRGLVAEAAGIGAGRQIGDETGE